ncbi:MAG: hypothetical protein JXX14_20490, partial [Deltaproteobacteria bacterium]|nr:hypothetical protein [Deltaproteobacteria bacterium]
MLKLFTYTGVALLLVSFIRGAAAAPVSGELFSATQPDGSLVTVRLYGDEFYIRAETEDGYTVVRDKANGWICYAELTGADDELVSTGIPFLGGALPTSPVDIDQFVT